MLLSPSTSMVAEELLRKPPLPLTNELRRWSLWLEETSPPDSREGEAVRSFAARWCGATPPPFFSGTNREHEWPMWRRR